MATTSDNADVSAIGTDYELARRRQHILRIGQWTDCEFIVGRRPNQQTIRAHKLILAMASPIFESMFIDDTARNNGPIPISDMRPETFKAFLEYIYTNMIRLDSVELACELGYCANKYLLSFLEEQCTKFVLSDLSPLNVCRAYEFAEELDKPVLMVRCLEVIRTKTDSVLKASSIEEIKLETLITILEQDTLEINSEIELLSAAERWAKAECVRKSLDPEDIDARRYVLGNALTKIRFLTLTPQELSTSSANSSLLRENEAAAMFLNISSGTLKRPMPEGFSTNTQRRKRPRCAKRANGKGA